MWKTLVSSPIDKEKTCEKVKEKKVTKLIIYNIFFLIWKWNDFSRTFWAVKNVRETKANHSIAGQSFSLSKLWKFNVLQLTTASCYHYQISTLLTMQWTHNFLLNTALSLSSPQQSFITLINLSSGKKLHTFFFFAFAPSNPWPSFMLSNKYQNLWSKTSTLYIDVYRHGKLIIMIRGLSNEKDIQREKL